MQSPYRFRKGSGTIDNSVTTNNNRETFSDTVTERMARQVGRGSIVSPMCPFGKVNVRLNVGLNDW